MTRPAFEINVRIPWWSCLVGWWNRRQFEKRDRAEKLRALHAPAYKGSMFGETKWMDTPDQWVQQTHRWDLYETPAGERSFVFIAMGGHPRKDGIDHGRHALVTRWIHGQWDFSWEDLRNGKVMGWTR